MSSTTTVRPSATRNSYHSHHRAASTTTPPTSSMSSGGHHHQPKHHSSSSSLHHHSNSSNSSRTSSHSDGGRKNYSNLIEIKSKFEAEFRRFSIQRTEITNLEDFIKVVEHFHKLFTIPFCLFYTDPTHGDLLPISNDTNFALAIASAKPLLRLIVQRKGESIDYLNTYGKKKNFFGTILPGVSSSSSHAKNRLLISAPEDFRQVSSIIDVDIVPETCRRVRLVKHGSDKPLGFYIRDGSSFRITEHGLEKVPGIFISRLVPGGLAESTGLLAVNDEVLEVNGIEVNGKSLDQVTDMMVANSSNLIITIRPANQRGQSGTTSGHHTLSGSFSANTIATSSTSGYHHQPHPTMHHHHLQPQHHHHHTNSLERSGHRSKGQHHQHNHPMESYHQYSYQPPPAQQRAELHQLPVHHAMTHHHHQQHTFEEVNDNNDNVDEEEEEDEDLVHDHFTSSNSNSNSNNNNNLIISTSNSISNSNQNLNSNSKTFPTQVFTLPSASVVECVTIGPSKASVTSTSGYPFHHQHHHGHHSHHSHSHSYHNNNNNGHDSSITIATPSSSSSSPYASKRNGDSAQSAAQSQADSSDIVTL